VIYNRLGFVLHVSPMQWKGMALASPIARANKGDAVEFPLCRSSDDGSPSSG
jgi:hypothetical protein